MIGKEVVLRMRMGSEDVHYAGELVNGAKMLVYFGDVGTELAIRAFGDESLFAGYSDVQFKAPVYSGDFVEYHGWIEERGGQHITCKFEAYKYITLPRDPKCAPSAANVLPKKVLFGTATGTLVVKKAEQRIQFADPEYQK
jgi:acyl-CoA thioesterase FadM